MLSAIAASGTTSIVAARHHCRRHPNHAIAASSRVTTSQPSLGATSTRWIAAGGSVRTMSASARSTPVGPPPGGKVSGRVSVTSAASVATTARPVSF
ncbi:Uncharacterised protein [Mycobacteroides abscessus subsp. abscessus]|nr:Uncharacterised protein [Mycobacteroides abscessus subsp. abscessus]